MILLFTCSSVVRFVSKVYCDVKLQWYERICEACNGCMYIPLVMFHCYYSYVSCVLGCPYEGHIAPEAVAKV